MPAQQTFMIVGANLTGGRAAEALRAQGFDGRVVLIGAEPHRPYERPPLSKEVLRGEMPPEKPFLRAPSWYQEQRIELELGVAATGVDVSARSVELADGRTLSFDKLLLATGGRVRRLSVPGADLDGVFTLRTMDDSLALRERFAPGVPVVVVGAGFIGSEVAASAKALGCEVTLLEMLPVPLARALGEEVGAICGEIHREHGVDLRTGIPGIERFEGDGSVRRVILSDGSAFDASVVVVGVGIDPEVSLAEAAGLELSNGIVVNERCETSVLGVYAAGDVASHPNPYLGARIRVEHWQNAQNQGAAAAKSMLGKLEGFAEVPWFWSDQYDVNIQMFGHPLSWDRIVFRGDVAGRNFSAFYMKDSRLVAALAVNRAKEARAARALIQEKIPVSADELADESTDLKALAKR